MTTLLEKITPNKKDQRWRFSTFKGINVAENAVVENAINTRVEIDVPEGKSLNKVYHLEAVAGMTIRELYLSAGKGAKLDFVLVNDLPLDVQNFNFLEVVAGADSEITVTILNFGAAYTRQEITGYVRGEGAKVNLRSLSVVDGTREVDQRTLQIHEEGNAVSDLLFKNVLDDSAKTIFSGLIRVAEGAQQTDAYQTNRNLLLTDEALAHTLPGLEIEANDVKCSHGATCGNLSAEDLFYLRARGIPTRTAQRMLIGGYCHEVIQGLPEDLQAWVSSKLEA